LLKPNSGGKKCFYFIVDILSRVVTKRSSGEHKWAGPVHNGIEKAELCALQAGKKEWREYVEYLCFGKWAFKENDNLLQYFELKSHRERRRIIFDYKYSIWSVFMSLN
jgi:hypothetical protein